MVSRSQLLKHGDIKLSIQHLICDGDLDNRSANIIKLCSIYTNYIEVIFPTFRSFDPRAKYISEEIPPGVAQDLMDDIAEDIRAITDTDDNLHYFVLRAMRELIEIRMLRYQPQQLMFTSLPTRFMKLLFFIDHIQYEVSGRNTNHPLYIDKYLFYEYQKEILIYHFG